MHGCESAGKRRREAPRGPVGRAELASAGAAWSDDDGRALATRDGSRHLHLWDVASASPILITAQTSLAQFPPWVAHPFSWRPYEPEVSLLDPIEVFREWLAEAEASEPNDPTAMARFLLDVDRTLELVPRLAHSLLA